MIHEVYDKESGAILYKKDEESLRLDALVDEVQSLQRNYESLEKRFLILENLFKHPPDFQNKKGI